MIWVQYFPGYMALQSIPLKAVNVDDRAGPTLFAKIFGFPKTEKGSVNMSLETGCYPSLQDTRK